MISTISEKYCKVLELDKILEELSALTCCEAARQRALAIRPYTNLSLVTDELEKTNDAFLLSARFGAPHFSNLQSPTESLKLAKAGGMLSTTALLNVAEVLRQVRLLSEWSRQGDRMENKLMTIFSYLRPNQSLEDRIHRVILAEDIIDDYASPALADIRRKIRAKQAAAKSGIERIIHSNKYQKMLQDAIVTQRDGRFVVPVKAEYRSEVPGLVHDTSGSGATLFIEPLSVVEANNEIRMLQTEEKDEIERILYELSALCAEQADDISHSFELILIINLYFAKAHLAEKMQATMPHVVEDGRIDLRQARHPLIDAKSVVPITVSLGDRYHTLVITGPNTGGKTVTLKTIGLLTLMTMCGMLIPVGNDSTISIFKKVLVDIGDEQSIEQSLSTFSAHMTNLVSILKQADQRSLVLVDELGSGTDPEEGAALATAILERLRELGAVTASTTHYSELKMYAIETDDVENACCEFDVKTLRPTYRLLIGVPGRSNAFAISRRLGLDEQLLERASTLVSNQDKSLETVIERLEQSRQQYEAKEAEYQKKLSDYNHRFEKMEEDQKKLDEEKEQILERAREKARKLVEDIQLQTDLLFEQVDRLRKEKEQEEFARRAAETKSKIRGELDRLHQEANPVSERSNEGYHLPRNLELGDRVLIYDINQEATVVGLPDRSGNVQVQAGPMKMRVKLKNLRLLGAAKKPSRPRTTVSKSVTKATERRGTSELDLRGKMVDEALMELDYFIDRSVMSHIETITIIHGKGTGALRRAVQGHLKGHKNVKTFRLGVFGEGESGVTIVTLK